MLKLKSSLLEQPFHLHFVEQQKWVSRLAQVSPEPILLARGLAQAPCAITVLHLPGEEKAWHLGSFLFPKSSRSCGIGRPTAPMVPKERGPGHVPHADHCLGTMLAGRGSTSQQEQRCPPLLPPAESGQLPLPGWPWGCRSFSEPPWRSPYHFIRGCRGFFVARLCCSNQLKYHTVDMGTSPDTSQTLVPMLIQALAWGPPLFQVQSPLNLSVCKRAPRGTPTWATCEDFILF